MEYKIEPRKSKYEDYINEIPNWKISEQDKKDVKKFFKDYEIGKITNKMSGVSTREGYVLYLMKVLEFLKKPVKKLTVTDIDNFSRTLLKDELKTFRDTPYAESVKITMRRILKQFLEWKLPNKAAKLVKPLKVIMRRKLKTPEFLSLQEINKLFKGCRSNVERYLIAMLFSSGARASEFYNIRKSDIELPGEKENFVKVTLREEFSKTRGRTISLYYENALEAVDEFLQDRISQGIEPEEPVWNICHSTTRNMLDRFGVYKGKLIDKKKCKWDAKQHKYTNLVYKKAELGRKILDRSIHFHLFRSSCATWLATKLNRQELCYYFGWRFSSPMPDIYISRAGITMKQVDDKLTQTEMSELKAKLSKQEHESKLRIDNLLSQLGDIKQNQDVMKRELIRHFKKEILVEIKNR